MALKIIEKKVYCVDSYDLDEFVQKIYGPIAEYYCFQAGEELGNDAVKEFLIGDITDYDKSSVNKFASTGDYSFITGSILRDLADRGLIPKGNYLVSV